MHVGMTQLPKKKKNLPTGRKLKYPIRGNLSGVQPTKHFGPPSG